MSFTAENIEDHTHSLNEVDSVHVDIETDTGIPGASLQASVDQTLGGPSGLALDAAHNIMRAESSRTRTQTTVCKEYTRQLLIDQFNGWIRKFDNKLKKLNQLKVTCDSSMKGLHDVYNSMDACFERVRSYIDQKEFKEFEEKLRKRDDLAQVANEDIFEAIKNLSLERQSDSSSLISGKGMRILGSQSRSSAKSHASKRSVLEEDRINKLSQVAAYKVELSFESQKEKKIAALEAQVKAPRNAETQELHTHFDDLLEIPKESIPEKQERIIKSLEDSAERGDQLPQAGGPGDPVVTSAKVSSQEFSIEKWLLREIWKRVL